MTVLVFLLMETLTIDMNGDLGQVERVPGPHYLNICGHTAVESRRQEEAMTQNQNHLQYLQ